MFTPFKIKKPIGFAHDHDLDDVVRTKEALKDLGHFKTPDYGLTAYPDEPMFDGIKSYQKTKGLDVDGVIKPDGPTAAEIGKDLSDRTPKFATFEIKPGAERDLPDHVLFTAKPGIRPAAQSNAAFDTAGDVGWGRTNNPDDVLAARRALAWAGHLPPTKTMDQKTPGNDLFEAIENFQRQAGVKKDGLMRPGGETAQALNEAIAPKVQTYLKSIAGQSSDPSEQGGRIQVAMAQKGRPLSNHGFTEGALPPNPWPVGSAAAIGTAAAAQEIINQNARRHGVTSEVPESPQPGQHNRRSAIEEPFPPTPPLEAHEQQVGKSDGEPADNLINTDIPALENPKIFNDLANGNPEGIEELKQILIVESRGDPRTKRLNNFCLDKMLEEARSRENVKSAVHLSGAASTDDGWKKEILRPAEDGVRGVRADAQVKITLKDGTERIEDFQSIDTYADGETPDLREADAIERIEFHKKMAKELGDILATPKRRDLTEEEAMEICAEKVEAFADAHWGPKKALEGS